MNIDTRSQTPTLHITPQMLQTLTPLAGTVVRLLAMLDDPDIPAREVAEVAARDVALSAHMLRLANSPAYGLSRHVGTIADALRVIGMEHVRLLVIAGGVGHLETRPLPCYDLPAGAFTRHSSLVAALALALARDDGYPDLGVAYTAGLLHDVGKVVLDQIGQRVGWEDEAVTVAARRGDGTLAEAEVWLCGHTHAEVGRQLGELWSLPAEICTAIASHHAPGVEREKDRLSWYVAVANRVACAADPHYPAAHRPTEPLEIDPVVLETASGVARQVLEVDGDGRLDDWQTIHALRARRRGPLPAASSTPPPSEAEMPPIGPSPGRSLRLAALAVVLIIALVLLAIVVAGHVVGHS